MTFKLETPARDPDWQDCYRGPLRPADTSARAVFDRALGAAPGWVRPAMALRNLLVAPFGLIRGAAPAGASGTAFLAQLPVVHDTPARFETGLTDRHLTFTIRIDVQSDMASARTLIWFHSVLGRAYLWVVLPAHRILMRHMVASFGRP